jgi:small subunit ribosomal protein S20
MAITQSAKKAIRQNERRKAQNSVYKNKIKSLVKEVRSLVLNKKEAEAKKLLPEIYAILDKSAKRGIIKKNNASRRKSRLTKMVDRASK